MKTVRQFFDRVFLPDVLADSSETVKRRYRRAIELLDAAAEHEATLHELTDKLIDSIGAGELSAYVANRQRQHLRRIIRYAETKGLPTGQVSPMLPSKANLDRGRKDRARRPVSPPSEPYVRFSRIRLSGWWFTAERVD